MSGPDRTPIFLSLTAVLLAVLLPGCGDSSSTGTTSGNGSAADASAPAKLDDSTFEQRQASNSLRTAKFAMRSDGPKSFDPIRGSTVYENRCASQVYETL